MNPRQDSSSDEEGEDIKPFRKGNIGILLKAQGICEDARLFEEPFPSPEQDATARVDAWKSASRLGDIKGAITEMDDTDDKYVRILCTHLNVSSCNIAPYSSQQYEIPPGSQGKGACDRAISPQYCRKSIGDK